MKTSTSEGKHGIQRIPRMQLDDLDFADDLALLSQTKQQMQEKATSGAAAPTVLGLNIHKGKSKILRYNTRCINPITIDGEELEDVKTFTYLSSMIDEQDGSDADVKARIGKVRAAYLQLKNIWKSKQSSTNNKLNLFQHGVILDLSTTEEHLELKTTVHKPTPKSEVSIQMSKQFYCMEWKLGELPQPSSRRYKITSSRLPRDFCNVCPIHFQRLFRINSSAESWFVL
ncbi:unnamed protein product [Schistosoma mattheei]|uniref:Uncharacterized protein n=1 Tax=Schistosoma mattheei TaxID=31246 RepID=A0A183P653_9TREM|nr:unnamed protein product [Schistosoma mattheei]